MTYDEHVCRLGEDFLDEYQERSAIMGEDAQTETEWESAQYRAYHRVCARRGIEPVRRQGELF